MKSRTIQILFGGLVLALGLLACNLPAGNSVVPTAAPNASKAAPGPVAQSSTPVADSAADEGMCPAVVQAPQSTGLISAVTMAEGTSGDERSPVNPTTTFAPASTFHAVVSVVDAPANTKLKAVWFAGDTDGVALCNKEIKVIELVTDGTRNVDFSLTPETSWPVGSFRVDIYANDVLDQTINFTVK